MFRGLWCCHSQGWINRLEVIQDLEQALQHVIAHLLLMYIILLQQFCAVCRWRLGNSGKEALLSLKSLGAAFLCTVRCTYTFEGYVGFVYVCFCAVLQSDNCKCRGKEEINYIM